MTKKIDVSAGEVRETKIEDQYRRFNVERRGGHRRKEKLDRNVSFLRQDVLSRRLYFMMDKDDESTKEPQQLDQEEGGKGKWHKEEFTVTRCVLKRRWRLYMRTIRTIYGRRTKSGNGGVGTWNTEENESQ